MTPMAIMILDTRGGKLMTIILIIFAAAVYIMGFILWRKYKHDIEWDKSQHALIQDIDEECILNTLTEKKYIYHYTLKIKYKGKEHIVKASHEQYWPIGTYIEYDVKNRSVYIPDDAGKMKQKFKWHNLCFIGGPIPLCLFFLIDMAMSTYSPFSVIGLFALEGCLLFITLKTGIRIIKEWNDYHRKLRSGLLTPIETEIYRIKVECRGNRDRTYNVYYPLVKYTDSRGNYQEGFFYAGMNDRYEVGEKVNMYYDKESHEVFPMNYHRQYAFSHLKYFLFALVISVCITMCVLDLMDIV